MNNLEKIKENEAIEEIELENVKVIKDHAINNYEEAKALSEDGEVYTIYLLTNVKRDIQKIYVGQTTEPQLKDRMGRKGNKYSNSPYLFNAINKYGYLNFEYTVLAYCNSKEIADAVEDDYIVKFDSRNPNIGYNLKEGGSHGKHSEETKKKISETLIRIRASWTEERRQKQNSYIMGWWKEKKRGPHTKEWKDNNSKMMQKRHLNQGHPMQGKHHSEEARAKISEANKGPMSQDELARRAATSAKHKEVKEKVIVAYQNNEDIDIICEQYGITRINYFKIINKYKKNNMQNFNIEE
jgi:group I intron endonuclease